MVSLGNVTEDATDAVIDELGEAVGRSCGLRPEREDDGEAEGSESSSPWWSRHFTCVNTDRAAHIPTRFREYDDGRPMTTDFSTEPRWVHVRTAGHVAGVDESVEPDDILGANDEEANAPSHRRRFRELRDRLRSKEYLDAVAAQRRSDGRFGAVLDEGGSGGMADLGTKLFGLNLHPRFGGWYSYQTLIVWSERILGRFIRGGSGDGSAATDGREKSGGGVGEPIRYLTDVNRAEALLEYKSPTRSMRLAERSTVEILLFRKGG